MENALSTSGWTIPHYCTPNVISKRHIWQKMCRQRVRNPWSWPCGRIQWIYTRKICKTANFSVQSWIKDFLDTSKHQNQKCWKSVFNISILHHLFWDLIITDICINECHENKIPSIQGKFKLITLHSQKFPLNPSKLSDLLAIRTAATSRTGFNFNSSATASIPPTKKRVKLSCYFSSLDKMISNGLRTHIRILYQIASAFWQWIRS